MQSKVKITDFAAMPEVMGNARQPRTCSVCWWRVCPSCRPRLEICNTDGKYEKPPTQDLYL